ncbi:hypothetical protein CMO88_05000 [Candidatus Woesearchaeota archaeon]|nr:hypothetical protein [Candidatus Woesearchaeota archaeon]|tara:strand:- start:526 stop:972 length:447 start_codon:yes stop_codon:yes gene_type:complete
MSKKPMYFFGTQEQVDAVLKTVKGTDLEDVLIAEVAPENGVIPFYSDPEITMYEESVTISVRGEPVGLTPSEYRFLSTLVSNPGIFFSQGECYEAITSIPLFNLRDRQALATHAKNVRLKLESDPSNPQLIINRYGLGYKYVPPPESA